jgi:iron complex transport system ATP-binding protein
MISVEKVSFAYQSDPVLREVSFDISAGEFIGIIGPNGAGKSTLLKLLNGILTPYTGKILLKDTPLELHKRKELAKIVGYVPQEFKTAFNFTVHEIVAMGRFPYATPFSRESSVDKKILESSMNATNVLEFKDRLFSELSGGEKQRVVLASALAQEPKILLMDEPTASLDLKYQIGFFEIVKNLQKNQNMTIISVTHDINLVVRYCEKLFVINDGKLVSEGSPGEIVNKTLIRDVFDVDVEIIEHPFDKKPFLVI